MMNIFFFLLKFEALETKVISMSFGFTLYYTYILDIIKV